MKHILYFSTLVAALSFNLSHLGASEEVELVGASSGKWTMDYDAALKVASEKKLPLILNFTGSDWCGWCKLMDKNVFAAAPWVNYAVDKVMLVTIDFPQDKLKVPEAYQARNNELKEKFEIQGYPTYVVLDSDGESVLGQLGAGRDKTPETFIEEFENIVRFSAGSIEAYSSANPDKAEAYKTAITELKSVEGELKDWIATRPQQNEENNKIFGDFKSRLEAAMVKLGGFK